MPITQIGFASPPTPAAYPTASRARGEQGTALLLAQVRQGGPASEIKLEQSSGFSRLDAAALAAARSWQFNAPKSPTWVRLPVRFALN
jgi:protein TonB